MRETAVELLCAVCSAFFRSILASALPGFMRFGVCCDCLWKLGGWLRLQTHRSGERLFLLGGVA